MVTFPGRLISYLLLVLGCLLGAGSLLIALWFLFVGALRLVSLNLSEPGVLALDAVLCLVFFVQHSVMIRRSFRRWMSGPLPSFCHGALYAAASGLALLLLVILWQESSRTIVEFHGFFRVLLRVIFVLALVGTLWSMQALGSFDTFGAQQILDHMHGKRRSHMPLTIRGPYRWVRHPLYVFMLLLMWSCPDLTLDRLMFNVLWTVWVIVATRLEERDLVEQFGDDYRSYQRRVPMLLPWKMRPIL